MTLSTKTSFSFVTGAMVLEIQVHLQHLFSEIRPKFNVTISIFKKMVELNSLNTWMRKLFISDEFQSVMVGFLQQSEASIGLCKFFLEYYFNKAFFCSLNLGFITVFNVQHVFLVNSFPCFVFSANLFTTFSKGSVRNPSTHDAPLTMIMLFDVVVIFSESILC